MCGIAGIVGPGASKARVSAMSAAIRHRGPDGDGSFTADGIALAHRRLKVIDLSAAAAQPMKTPDGRKVIVFNGEIYNYRALRRQLGEDRFRSQSDTEVLLAALDRWGTGALERLDGMFAFAVWDVVERSLLCGRDRLGIKPFYLSRVGQDLLFASELRALFAAGVSTEPHEGVLYDFLARDFYSHGDDTFFRQVTSLPAGTTLRVEDGHLHSAQRYWNLAAQSEAFKVPSDRGAREERLIELLAAAVDSQLVSDVPVGVALSGGLDSATLLALIARNGRAQGMEAFSFVVDDERYSERPFIEAMGASAGVHCNFVDVRPEDFAAGARAWTASQEEPFAGAPIAAYAMVHRRIRETGTVVVMDGSGLDEAFAGYTRFLPAYWADLQAAGELAGLERELAAAGVVSAADRERAHLQMRVASSPTADVGVGQDLTTSVRPDCLSEDFIARAARPPPAFERPFPDALRNLMFRELRYTKLPRALRFRDRLSMAEGLELRPPFLDHRLLAYAFALPASDLISAGASKAILRRATSRLLPEVVRLAAKRSVQTPQREWFRGSLASWLRETIDQKRLWDRGWVSRERALGALDAFLAGRGDNSFFLWQWANLALWLEEVVDNPALRAGPARPAE